MHVIHQTSEIRRNALVKDDRKYFSYFICGGIKRKRSALKGAPGWNSSIVIQQENVENEFGANLVTYKAWRKDGQRYYRHFLRDVQVTRPAGEMRIEDDDEILLINDQFAQENSHEEMIDVFGNVKVDGRTRFALVIRRLHKKRFKKVWTWIETSAVLAPDFQIHPVFDEHPTAEDVEYKKVENNKVEIKTTHRYKISGTQLYLDINNKTVTADVCTGTERDKTKIIWKRQRYWQDEDGLVHFEAALCDENLENYIAVGSNNEITLKDEPIWFDQTEIGSNILFRFKDVYLGYNFERDQVDAQTSEFHFEEIPGDVELDSPIPLSICDISDRSLHRNSACSQGFLISQHETLLQRGCFSSLNASGSSGYQSVAYDLGRPSHYMSRVRETTV